MSPSEQLDIWIPFLGWIFDHGFWAAFLGCLLVSHAWSWTLVEFGEDRHFPWRRRDNFLGYLAGEVCLGFAVACLVQTFNTLEVNAPSWALIVSQGVILAIAARIGWAFRESERNRTGTDRVQDEEAWMASKIHHDLFIMPFFIFMLLSCALASLIFASWDLETWIWRGSSFLFVATWGFFVLVDGHEQARRKIVLEPLIKPHERTPANTKQFRRSRWR